MIARYFAFGQESDEQRNILADAGINLMFVAIKPVGLLLARLPAGDGHADEIADALDGIGAGPATATVLDRVADNVRQVSAGLAKEIDPV